MSTSRGGGSRRINRGGHEEEEDDDDYDYWAYLPQGGLMEFVPSWRRSPNLSQSRSRQTSDPWWLFEERFARELNYGLPSRLSQQLLLIDDYNSRPRRRDNNTPPQTNHHEQPRLREEEEPSKLSGEEQKQALNKLRKQLYSPHTSNIIRRLGNKKEASHSKIDDDMKKCAICLEDFESRRFVTSTPCDHLFHEECIVPWVKAEGKCPVCRHALVEKGGNSRGGSNAMSNVDFGSRGINNNNNNRGIGAERGRGIELVRSFGRGGFY